MMSPLVRFLFAMTCLSGSVLLPAQALGAQPIGCRFVLGFAALRDMVGAQKIGECLEDEHFNLENGNSEQRTKGGLLVWRKVDNFTAFTDGATSWINGPGGLQSRPNGERFAWEKDPVAPATSAVASGGTMGPTSGPEAAATPTMRATATLPPARQPATPTLAPRTPTPAPSGLTPELASRCVRSATGIMMSMLPEMQPGSGDVAVRAQDAMINICRDAGTRYGTRGVECFESSFRQGAEMNRTLPAGSGLGGQAAFALLQRCLEGR